MIGMFGSNFWQFNVMEAFATIAILVGATIAIWKWAGEHNRRNALISFPYEKWSAKIDAQRKIVRFDACANVLVPCHAFGFDATIRSGKTRFAKRLHAKNQGMNSAIGGLGLELGRQNYWGEMPLSDIPKGVFELGIKIGVRIDGELMKTSRWFTLQIVPDSKMPDKEDSQP